MFLLFNDGGGSFSAPEELIGLRGPAAPGDFDGDGDVDLAAISDLGEGLSIFWNDGGGSFPDRLDFGPESSGSEVAAGDLDGDGRTDLAAVGAIDGLLFDDVRVHLNGDGGAFSAPLVRAVGDSPDAIEAIDLDRDGRLDLAVLNQSSSDVSILLNRGAPPASSDDDADGIPDACKGGMLPGDCNSDRGTDISDAVCLLGHLFLGDPVALPCGSGQAADPGNLALLDLNGDEVMDLSDPIYLLGHLFLGDPPPVQGKECLSFPGCPDACPPR
jgi:hypothetical protein